MALLYPGLLPPGALLNDAAIPVVAAPPLRERRALPPPAPIWFSAARADAFTFNDAGRVQTWAAMGQPNLRAEAVSHNKDGTEWRDTRGALQFHAKIHSGLTLPKIVPHGNLFSIGLIYQPPQQGSAMAIASLQAAENDNYFFISAENGVIRFAERDAETSLGHAEPATPTLVVISSDGSRVKMTVNRSLATSVDCALPDLPHDFLIGCRGTVRSLVNKLGSFGLTDVMIWPDQDVLAEGIARAPEAALAHWQERLQNGCEI